MILDPGNDRACLGQLTTMARELHRTTLVQIVARRLGTRENVLAWLRSLPQTDDGGRERYRYISCDVGQRVRLLPDDPNCFERAFAALILLEVLEPTTARMLLTIDRPQRHTGIVEARGGRWIALDLFPRRNTDWAKVGKDVTKGIHTYVGKPLLTMFAGQAGGQLADTVGGLQDKAFAQVEKKPAPKPAQRPQAPARRSQPARPQTAAVTMSAPTVVAALRVGPDEARARTAQKGDRENVEEETRRPVVVAAPPPSPAAGDDDGAEEEEETERGWWW